MKFSPFSENREKMLGQYKNVFDQYDRERSGALFSELKTIYDNEKYEVLGKGKALKYFFERVELFVNTADVFADLSATEDTPLRIRKEVYASFHKKKGEARKLTNESVLFANGDYGHTSPDWKRLLTLGFTGIVKEAETYLERPDITEEQGAFYTSVKLTYEGIIIFTKRLYEAVKSTPSANSEFTAENLLALTVGAPKTIAEAMQLYFIYYAAQQKHDGAVLRSLGAVDELLYPFYKSDLENGVFTEEEIRELVKYYLFKWHSMKVEANIPFDLSATPNELSYIILEEYTALDIHDPKLHVICSEKTPKKFTLEVLRAIRSGKSSFVFMNDKTVREALVKIGVSEEDSKNYTLIGCYEPGIIGKELPCTVNGRISMPKAVEYAMKNLESDADAPTFEAFLDKVKAELSHFIDVAVTEVNTIEEKYPKIFQAPTLSATYECCMQRGKEIYSGGADYNNSSLALFGIATYTDELLAIKRAVYDEKKLTVTELRAILENNWSGSESLRREIMKYDEKYGSSNPVADAFACETIEFLSKCLNGRPNGRGGVHRLGLFSIDWIFPYGKALGASADGRHAGDPISKNLSASVGMDKKGITGLMRSVLKQDHTLIPNGAVLDLALHPTSVKGEEGLEIMYSLLSLYFAGGGFAIQMNVVGRETLEAAQREPEKYKNLQIRLCGWNVYFTDLEREVQDQIIESMVNQ